MRGWPWRRRQAGEPMPPLTARVDPPRWPVWLALAVVVVIKMVAIRDHEIAAINSGTHCVLSVLARDIPTVSAALDRLGVTWARLPIRFPFHSAAIEPLAEPMARLTAGFRFADSRWPIVSASSGGVVSRFDGAHIWQVMRGPLRFRETIDALAREGEWVLMEAGPSGTLASFTRQVRAPGVTAWPSIDQFGQNARTMKQLMAAVA